MNKDELIELLVQGKWDIYLNTENAYVTLGCAKRGKHFLKFQYHRTRQIVSVLEVQEIFRMSKVFNLPVSYHELVMLPELLEVLS